MSRDVDHPPDTRLAIALTALVVGAPGAIMIWAHEVRYRLPDPVAVHWGLQGDADGFASLESSLAALLAPAVLSAALTVAAVIGRQPAVLRRMLAGMAAGLSVLLAVLVGDSLRVQIDLSDATAVPLPAAGIWTGLVLAVVAGMWGARMVADDGASARAAAAAPPPSALRLAPHEAARGAWTGRSPLPRSLISAIVLVLGALTFVAPVTIWPLLAVVAISAVALAAMSAFTVVIDHRGLTATAARLRLLQVPLEEVAEASLVGVNPFWEFGGCGLRVDTAGRVGLVSRSGEALRIQRGDGSEVIITIDDAAAAAANLNTLADRIDRA